MKLKTKILGTACGLSLLLGGAVIPVHAAPAPHTSPASAPVDNLNQAFSQIALTSLKGIPHAAAALVVADTHGTSVVYAGDMKPESSAPLGRLGELFTSLVALQQIEAGSLKVDASANDYLDGYALAQPFGEITIRHLLERSSGLPLREGSLYISEASKIPTLKNLLIQDLKPAVLTPGEAISSHSFGDLALGEAVASAGKKPLDELVQTQLLTPLGLKEIKLPDPKAQDLTLPGHDSTGAGFRRLRGSAHVIHDWIGRPSDMGPLLSALLGKSPQVISPIMQKQLFTHSLAPESRLATSSLGLLESWQQNRHFFYLDSDWFGYTARLAVFPGQTAFLLVYNTSDPALKEQLTQSFIAKLPPDAEQNRPKAKLDESAEVNVRIEEKGLLPFAHPYAKKLRDSNSLLKAYNLLDTRPLQVSDKALGWQGKSWQPVEQRWANESGQELTHMGTDLVEGYDTHDSWYQVGDWGTWQLQLAIAVVFGLLFLSALFRAIHFLYAYQPQVVDYSLDPKQPHQTDESQTDQAAESEATAALSEAVPAEAMLEVAPEEARASLDVPMAAMISSLLAITFTAGIYPVMMFADRVGDQSSLVVRNEPSGWLIAWLAMPLIALITALILLAFVSANWKLRPWTRGEKWHYLLYCLGVPLWAAWLASWNLLGFRF